LVFFVLFIIVLFLDTLACSHLLLAAAGSSFRSMMVPPADYASSPSDSPSPFPPLLPRTGDEERSREEGRRGEGSRGGRKKGEQRRSWWRRRG
jgi:hypothetical protein